MFELKDRITTLNKDYYNKTFINEFLTSFPDIYSREELEKIIDEQVSKVFLCDGNIEQDVVGGYYTEYKSIVLTNSYFDNIAFHEYIHAIRNTINLYKHKNTIYTSRGFEKHDCDDGLEEAFIELITIIYEKRKSEKKYNNLIDVSYNSDDVDNYEITALFANELEYLITLVNKDCDLVKMFLQGKNIRKEIYNIMYAFVHKIENHNLYSKEELNYMAYQISYYYLELMLFITNDDVELANLVYILENINNSIGFVLNNNKQSNISKYSLNRRLYSDEELTNKIAIEKYDFNDFNNDISKIVIFLDNYDAREDTTNKKTFL